MEVKPDPPAELLVCPEAPAGFPERAAPAGKGTRDALERVVPESLRVRRQLSRLINYLAPGSCNVELPGGQ